jgi:hypothetical protein
MTASQPYLLKKMEYFLQARVGSIYGQICCAFCKDFWWQPLHLILVLNLFLIQSSRSEIKFSQRSLNSPQLHLYLYLF